MLWMKIVVESVVWLFVLGLIYLMECVSVLC